VSIWILVAVMTFSLIVIWWLGNLMNGLRKQNEDLTQKFVGMVQQARITQLDNNHEEMPGWIPWATGEGGFRRLTDGSWVAEGNGPIPDSPLGGSTTSDVEGAFPSNEVEMEEEL
jgi:hypothetical protein